MTDIEVRSLYKVFGRDADEAVRRLQAGESREDVRTDRTTPAVIDASFQVRSGESFVVMGLSGSGKSTLLRMLNGLLPSTAGTVQVGGDDITALSANDLRTLRARRMSMVFQHFALFPHRTVLENAGYGLEVQRVPAHERERRAREALEMVGLEGWEDSVPDQLSGGMQQRVGLARALATNADVLLMDEAFSALDPLIRREMQDQMVELQRTLHKTIVFITHDLNEAMRLGDRVAVMRDGRIVQIGTPQQILAEPADDYVAQFVADVDRSRVLTARTVMEPPAPVVRADDAPARALEVLREWRATGLFVVDGARRMLGTLTDDQVADAARSGRPSLEPDGGRDVTTVHPDTPVAELLTPAAESRLPLAVVDDERRLVGVVPRATLLAALGGATAADPYPAGQEEVSDRA